MVVVVCLLIDVLDIASLGNWGSGNWGLLDLDLVVIRVHMGLDPVVVVGAPIEVLLSVRVLDSLKVGSLVVHWVVNLGSPGVYWVVNLGCSGMYRLRGGVCLDMGVWLLVVGSVVVGWLVVSRVCVDVGRHFCWLDFIR